jgi:hypothetical protein
VHSVQEQQSTMVPTAALLLSSNAVARNNSLKWCRMNLVEVNARTIGEAVTI